MVQKSPKKFLWTNLARPFFALAPMAGYTDQPFRLICKSFGADVMFSEMISSEAIYHKLKVESGKLKVNEKLYKSLRLIEFSQKERPFIVQIFGANPEHMAYAAEYIASGQWHKDYLKTLNSKLETLNKSQTQNSKSQTNSLGFRTSNLEFTSIPSGIDVNMGCPARDVIKTGAGSALMKNPQLAVEIIKSIKKKIKIPVSIKTRLGWQDNKSILKFARILEYAGADAITIHGRTYKQGFSGPVDWQTICQVKKQLKIPVIGNGAINNNFQLSTNNHQLDGYMIGQGALGNPWIFNKLKVESGMLKVDEDYNISLNERRKVVLRHVKLAEKLNGKRGVVEFRKHLLLYFRGLPNSARIRKGLVRVANFNDVGREISKI